MENDAMTDDFYTFPDDEKDDRFAARGGLTVSVQFDEEGRAYAENPKTGERKYCDTLRALSHCFPRMPCPPEQYPPGETIKFGSSPSTRRRSNLGARI
jgi:hypothetical protein